MLALPAVARSGRLMKVVLEQLINLRAVFCVVMEGGPDLIQSNRQVLGGLFDVAIAGPDRFHDLPDVKTTALECRLSAGRGCSEDDARMLLPSKALVEQGSGDVALVNVSPLGKRRQI